MSSRVDRLGVIYGMCEVTKQYPSPKSKQVEEVDLGKKHDGTKTPLYKVFFVWGWDVNKICPPTFS